MSYLGAYSLRERLAVGRGIISLERSKLSVGIVLVYVLCDKTAEYQRFKQRIACKAVDAVDAGMRTFSCGI